MRVAIVGAGAVGRSIAQALLDHRHKVLLIERRRAAFVPTLVPGADWMLADACELGTLDRAGIHTCDVALAASGDDKVNLVFAMLAKTECGVSRVVARVNRPDNEWLFTQAWGVDVAVSTPRALASGVDTAVTTGDLITLMTLQHGAADLLEITLGDGTPLAGVAVGELTLPVGAVVLTVAREGMVIAARREMTLRAGDTLMFAANAKLEPKLRAVLRAA